MVHSTGCSPPGALVTVTRMTLLLWDRGMLGEGCSLCSLGGILSCDAEYDVCRGDGGGRDDDADAMEDTDVRRLYTSPWGASVSLPPSEPAWRKAKMSEPWRELVLDKDGADCGVSLWTRSSAC